jgi:hypothetical protein
LIDCLKKTGQQPAKFPENNQSKNCNPITQNYPRILKIIQQVLSPLNWRTIPKKLRYFHQKLASQYLAKKSKLTQKCMKN